MNVLSIRGGSGLGDAIYVQSVVRHLVEQGRQLEVCTAWPDVFRPVADKVRFSPFRRGNVTYVAHYADRRGVVGTTQFEDCCIKAGVPKDVDLRLDWTPLNGGLVQQLRGIRKPIVVVQMPRAPFGRVDGQYTEFAPQWGRVQQAIDLIGRRAFTIMVGSGVPDVKYSGIDLDLSNQTSVSDLIDVGYAAHGFLGQCSFIIPLAESFRKPVQLIWSRAGLKSRHEVIRQMTPAKILHRPISHAVIDDCSDSELRQAVDALCEQVGSQVAA